MQRTIFGLSFLATALALAACGSSVDPSSGASGTSRTPHPARLTGSTQLWFTVVRAADRAAAQNRCRSAWAG